MALSATKKQSKKADAKAKKDVEKVSAPTPVPATKEKEVKKGGDAEAKEIMDKYGVFEPAEWSKVRCKLTGHELIPTPKLLNEYIATKKFQTAYKIHEIVESNPKVFEELDDKLIGCRLTKKVLAKDPATLLKHLEGKKFKKAVASGKTGDEDDEEEDVPMGDDEEMLSGEDDVIMEGEESEDEESADDEEDDEDEDDDDDVEEEEVYPELTSKGKSGKKSGGATQAASLPVDEDSYDFAVMDTEVESISKGRKRKTEAKPQKSAQKKKIKRAA